jgi:hypothetical protein
MKPWIPILLAYLVPLDVDVTGNITPKLCEVWSEVNIFCTLFTVATAPILNFFQPIKSYHPLLLCNGNFSYYSYYSSSTHFCPLDFSEMP